MKITKRQLRGIIKEEKARLLKEQGHRPADLSPGGHRGPFGDVFDKLNNMYYSIKDTSGEPGGKSVLEQQQKWESLLIKAFNNTVKAWQQEREDPDAWWKNK